MKTTLMVMVLLGFSAFAQAKITGCSFEGSKEFEELTSKYTVKLMISNQINIDSRSDYRSGENYELWMKKASDKQRTIAANAAVKVENLTLMGEENSPDTLVMMFSKSSEMDTMAFYSRDEDSVIAKLRESKILHLTCTPK